MIMTNKQIRACVTFMLLSLVCFTGRVGVAADNTGIASDETIRITSLGTPQLTDDHLIVPLKATGAIQYDEPVSREYNNGRLKLVYVDMPNTQNDIASGWTVREKMAKLIQEQADLPVTRITLSQFQLDPPNLRRSLGHG